MKRILFLLTLLAIIMMALGCEEDEKRRKIQLTPEQEVPMENACKHIASCGSSAKVSDCVTDLKEALGEVSETLPPECTDSHERYFNCIANASCDELIIVDVPCESNLYAMALCLKLVSEGVDIGDETDDETKDEAPED